MTLIWQRKQDIFQLPKIPHAWNFEHDSIGWNDRMPNLNAAFRLRRFRATR